MVFRLGVLGLFKSRSRLANAKIGSHCRARCDRLFKCELGWHFSCNHGFHAFFAICDFNARWQPHAKTHGPCQRVQGHQIWISSHFLIHTKKLSTLVNHPLPNHRLPPSAINDYCQSSIVHYHWLSSSPWVFFFSKLSTLNLMFRSIKVGLLLTILMLEIYKLIFI